MLQFNRPVPVDVDPTMFQTSAALVIVTLLSRPSTAQAAPVIQSAPLQLTARDGDNVTLPCVTTDLGHHKVVWRRGNEIISVMKKNVLKKVADDPRLEPTAAALTLHRVVAPDSGVYRCEVFDSPDSPVVAQLAHSVTVQSSAKYEAPRIGDTPEHLTPHEGSSITLSCGVSGHPPPTVQWTKAVSTTSAQRNCGCTDASLPMSVARSTLGVSENITFVKVQRSDSGVYNCTASNGVGEVVTFSIVLQVMFAPSVSVPLAKVHSGKDVPTVLCCDVEGYPQPTIRWLKYEKPSNPYRNVNSRGSEFGFTEGYTGSRRWSDHRRVWGFHEDEDQNWVPVSPTRLARRTCSNGASDMVRNTLHIARFLKQDFGTYRCYASSPMGEDSGSVAVSGEPWALNVVSETDSTHANSYMLAWQVNSYSDILHYELSIKRVSDEEEEPTMNYTVPSIKKQLPTYHSQVKNLTGLAAGSTYEVHVRAKNDYGYADLELPFFFHTINEDGTYTTDYVSTPGLTSSYAYPTDYSDGAEYQQLPDTEVEATVTQSQSFPASNELPHSDTLHGNASLSGGTSSPAPPSAPPPHATPPALGALLTAVALSAFFSLSASRWCAG